MIRNSILFLIFAFIAGLFGFGFPTSALASYAIALFWIGLATSLASVFASLWSELRQLEHYTASSDFQG